MPKKSITEKDEKALRKAVELFEDEFDYRFGVCMMHAGVSMALQNHINRMAADSYYGDKAWAARNLLENQPTRS